MYAKVLNVEEYGDSVACYCLTGTPGEANIPNVVMVEGLDNPQPHRASSVQRKTRKATEACESAIVVKNCERRRLSETSLAESILTHLLSEICWYHR